jgi:hypothetical protein
VELSKIVQMLLNIDGCLSVVEVLIMEVQRTNPGLVHVIIIYSQK